MGHFLHWFPSNEEWDAIPVHDLEVFNEIIDELTKE
jgi:hypothetical protein